MTKRDYDKKRLLALLTLECLIAVRSILVMDGWMDEWMDGLIDG